MCGIAGIYNTTGEPPESVLLAAMAAAIAHRGPDGERFHFDGGLGLAHRHLRIIDLSDAAMQPMTNEDGSLWLIFNGEVYNYIELRPELEARGHRFASHSDTEVVIHAYEEWGAACLYRFNGMFAFALWDTKQRTLVVARDRMGVKPLYYCRDGASFAFASEIKALLRLPWVDRTPNLPAIAEYMSAMYTVGDHTWFKGVKRLLPGHYLLVGPQGLAIRQWWDIPADEEPLGTRREEEYVEEVRALLEDSVRLRLRSDVPLGSHLSGGLDSSAVVGLLSSQLAVTGERLRTFSGAFAEGSAYDERRYAHAVVHRYHTDHHEIVPSAEDLPRLMDLITWHMDEPAAGPGVLLQWAVCALTRRAGVTVINGGQGGDEAWAGYFGYIPAYLRGLLGQLRHNPALLGRLSLDALSLLTHSSTRQALYSALRNRRRGRLRATSSLGEWAGERFKDMPHARSGERGHWQETGARSPLAAATYLDMKWYLPALLQVEDRTSMAFSLESRAPLLDYRLIEWSTKVPPALKLKGLQTKHMLRAAVGDLVPSIILKRRDKMGMPTPISTWFGGSLATWLESQLVAPEVRQSGLLDTRYVRQALREHTLGGMDRSVDLWKALSVVSWWRVFQGAKAPQGAHPASGQQLDSALVR